jgi:hypothetical protein
MVETPGAAQGCWNVRGRRFDGSHTDHGATFTAGQAGACCSTAHYRPDDRAPAARELQLIREARRRDGLRGWMDCRGVCALPPKVQLGSPSVCRSCAERPAAVFGGLS